MSGNLQGNGRADEPGETTLGDVLYAGGSKESLPSETDWVDLLRSVGSGNQLALRDLYDRTHRLVFTLIMRFTADPQSAEELTLDVFHDVWRRAAGFDPTAGTVLGWIMNQARSRAIDHLRFVQRKKRIHPGFHEGGPDGVGVSADDLVGAREDALILRAALTVLSPLERQAIETAFFSDITYVEAAARLNEPVGTIKTRIRSGLHKLRLAMTDRGKA